MKKVFLSYLVSAIALMSCSKDDKSVSTSSQEIAVSSVPSAIRSYIIENYPDATISAVLKYSGSDTTYAITLNTNEFLAFDNRLTPFSGNRDELLCDSINGHPGGHHGGGHHGSGHNGGGHHGGGIPADSVPVTITDYIAANYIGYTVHHVWYDTLCQFGFVYDVMIESADNVHNKLVFDATGLFLASANRFITDSLPAVITDAIALNYGSYTLRHKAEQFTLADGSLQYKVYLHLDSTRISVVFASDGSLVCEQ